jgi:hypothetical protein
MAVVVDAFERMLRRGAGADVSEESSKVVDPFGADRDATAPVTGIVLACGKAASVPHTAPSPILGRAPRGRRRPVCSEPLRVNVVPKTTAAFGLALAQNRTGDLGHVPAIALACVACLAGSFDLL